jgi:hypothetical protein
MFSKMVKIDNFEFEIKFAQLCKLKITLNNSIWSPIPREVILRKHIVLSYLWTWGGGIKEYVSTAIYFMLRGAQKSQFHRIQSDELWFFHDGEALEIAVIINQQLIQYELGLDLASGQLPPSGLFLPIRGLRHE